MITVGFFNYLELLLLTLFKNLQEVAPESEEITGHDPPKRKRGVVVIEVKPHWTGQRMDNR